MIIGYLYDFEAYPPKGGNHVHAFELVQGFLKLGHSVYVVDDPTMPGAVNYNGNLESLQRFMQAVDVLYVRIDARFIADWTALKICVDHIGRCSIVWEINAPSNETLAYSWLGGKIANEQEGWVRRARRWLHAVRKIPSIAREERYRRYIAKKVDAAICVSKQLGRYAADELGIKNVRILPNGGPLLSAAEIQERSQKRESQAFTVLYSGSAMYPWQGLDLLTETIELAAKEAPEIHFVLAVNQRTADLPSTANVQVLEHLNRQEIIDAICAADVCVSLHPDYSWSKYGFHNSPMKMFEYMACMKPVVASNHGQMRDILQDGSGVLCENDPRDILNKLIYLQDNPSIVTKLGYQGWQRIHSEFSWQNNVKESVKLFVEIAGK